MRSSGVRPRRLGLSGGRTAHAAYRELYRGRCPADQEVARQNARVVCPIATVRVLCRILSRAIAERDGGLKRSDTGKATGQKLLLRRPCRVTGMNRKTAPSWVNGHRQSPHVAREPSGENCCEDPGHDQVYVHAWAGLRPKAYTHLTRGIRRPHSIARGTLVLVDVSRLSRPTLEPRMLWLWWHGQGEPDLALL